MTRALVTGGAGFIGSHLVEALLRQGDRVTVLDNLSTGSESNLRAVRAHPALSLHVGSILDEALVDRLTREADMVYHLAAAVGVQWVLQHPLESLRTNVRGTEVVLASAARWRARVLLASTSEVYGKNDAGALDEDADRVLGSTRLSRWNYAAAKGLDESLALAYWAEQRLPVVIVRFFNTIGPRQSGRYGMVVPRFVEQALRNEPLTVYGDGQQTRCFTYVADAVEAVRRLAQCQAAVGEVFNIGQAREITIEALARRVIELTGSRSEIVFVPYEQAYPAGFEDMRRRVPDCTRLRRMIDFAPSTGLDEALAAIIHEHRALLGTPH